MERIFTTNKETGEVAITVLEDRKPIKTLPWSYRAYYGPNANINIAPDRDLNCPTCNRSVYMYEGKSYCGNVHCSERSVYTNDLHGQVLKLNRSDRARFEQNRLLYQATIGYVLKEKPELIENVTSSMLLDLLALPQNLRETLQPVADQQPVPSFFVYMVNDTSANAVADLEEMNIPQEAILAIRHICNVSSLPFVSAITNKR